MDDESNTTADLADSNAAPEAPAEPLSLEERQQLVARILERQERLQTLAERARQLRQPRAAELPASDSIALRDASSLRFDPEARTWRFQANPDAESRDVQFAGVRYGLAEAPAIAVDADQGTFSVELPHSPGKLRAPTTPSELLRRAVLRGI